MRLEQNVQVATSVALERIRANYFELLQSPALSLQDLFNYDDFRLKDYCIQFAPHPQSQELLNIAESFGDHYGIWISNAKHYITCTLYLYPLAEFDRMAAIVKNNSIDYYLNDTMGRDVFKFLSWEEQKDAKKIIQRMAHIDADLRVIPSAQPVELANVEVLKTLRDTSNEEWFSRFLKLYSYHIGVTHKDLNASTTNHISSISEYMRMRNHTSGMHHIMMLIEYNQGTFLDWSCLEMIDISRYLRRVHWAAAAFGALSNDLFSFEKEVIDNGTDSNLVMIIALNHPELTLQEVILWAANIVRNLLSECMNIMNVIRQKMKGLPRMPAALIIPLTTHLDGLDRCIQASWLWQVYTKRYKRPQSIWEETCLVS